MVISFIFPTDNFQAVDTDYQNHPYLLKEMKTLSNQTSVSILISVVPYAMLFEGQVQNRDVHRDYVQENPRDLQDDIKSSIFVCPSMISVEMNFLCPTK